MKHGLLLLIPALWWLPPKTLADDEWTTYENSTLATQKYFDGDSFHVYAEGNRRRHYIFRLYFVDAPEVDDSFPERVEDQAEHFDTEDTDAVMELGRDAADQIARMLAEPFTVYTKKVKAGGRTAKPRYYAMIKTSEGIYLSEWLAQNGLARVHGTFPEETPDNIAAARFRMRLRSMLSDAKDEGLGGYALSEDNNRLRRPRPGLPQIEPQTVRLRRLAFVYSLEQNRRPLGRLRPGHEVQVIGAETPQLVRVKFVVGEDREIEGLMRRSSLGL